MAIKETASAALESLRSVLTTKLQDITNKEPECTRDLLCYGCNNYTCPGRRPVRWDNYMKRDMNNG